MWLVQLLLRSRRAVDRRVARESPTGRNATWGGGSRPNSNHVIRGGVVATESPATRVRRKRVVEFSGEGGVGLDAAQYQHQFFAPNYAGLTPRMLLPRAK